MAAKKPEPIAAPDDVARVLTVLGMVERDLARARAALAAAEGRVEELSNARDALAQFTNEYGQIVVPENGESS